MFKKATAGAFFLLLISASYLFYCCFYIVPKDIKKYENSLEKSREKKTVKQEIRQDKKEVQKDIWQASATTDRLHYKISSDASLLIAKPSKGKYVIKEWMENTDCWIQEAIERNQDQNKQHIKRVRSEKGLYQLSPLSFVSEKVDLSFYTLASSDLSNISLNDPPYLKGHAKKVIFKLVDKKPFFHAERFKAESTLSSDK